jgi:hypothetical protein
VAKAAQQPLCSTHGVGRLNNRQYHCNPAVSAALACCHAHIVSMADTQQESVLWRHSSMSASLRQHNVGAFTQPNAAGPSVRPKTQRYSAHMRTSLHPMTAAQRTACWAQKKKTNRGVWRPTYNCTPPSQVGRHSNTLGHAPAAFASLAPMHHQLQLRTQRHITPVQRSARALPVTTTECTQ